jgi:phospholipid/cholesterol/gamma-HCH transport system substrate-binding protein
MKFAKEIWIGLTFLVALALFIWGVNFLKGSSLFQTQTSYYAVYDRVDGLNNSSPVTLNGVKIGQVETVRFHPDGSGRIVVKMLITEPFGIPRNTVAAIISSDLLGSKEINLRLGDAGVFCQSGDTLPSDIQKSLQEEVNLQVAPLKKKAEDLMASLDSMVTVISLIFNENLRSNLQESIGSIQKTIEHLRSTTSSLDTLMGTQRTRLENIIAHTEAITLNLRNNNESVTNILTNLNELTDSIAGADVAGTLMRTNAVMKEVEQITASIARGEGTMGMLVNDDQLYHRLENASKDLDLLLQDMRLNPDRYLHFSVFGKNPRKGKYAEPDTSLKR